MRQFYKDADGGIAFELSAPTGFTLVTGVEQELLWDSAYKERSEDGQRYYHESQRSLYLSLIDGVYTFAEVKDYEAYTASLADVIFKGNWLTAQDVCTNLPTSGIFDTAKKAEIQLYIDDYVASNY